MIGVSTLPAGCKTTLANDSPPAATDRFPYGQITLCRSTPLESFVFSYPDILKNVLELSLYFSGTKLLDFKMAVLLIAFVLHAGKLHRISSLYVDP